MVTIIYVAIHICIAVIHMIINNINIAIAVAVICIFFYCEYEYGYCIYYILLQYVHKPSFIEKKVVKPCFIRIFIFCLPVINLYNATTH